MDSPQQNTHLPARQPLRTNQLAARMAKAAAPYRHERLCTLYGGDIFSPEFDSGLTSLNAPTSTHTVAASEDDNDDDVGAWSRYSYSLEMSSLAATTTTATLANTMTTIASVTGTGIGGSSTTGMELTPTPTSAITAPASFNTPLHHRIHHARNTSWMAPATAFDDAPPPPPVDVPVPCRAILREAHPRTRPRRMTLPVATIPTTAPALSVASSPPHHRHARSQVTLSHAAEAEGDEEEEVTTITIAPPVIRTGAATSPSLPQFRLAGHETMLDQHLHHSADAVRMKSFQQQQHVPWPRVVHQRVLSAAVSSHSGTVPQMRCSDNIPPPPSVLRKPPTAAAEPLMVDAIISAPAAEGTRAEVDDVWGDRFAPVAESDSLNSSVITFVDHGLNDLDMEEDEGEEEEEGCDVSNAGNDGHVSEGEAATDATAEVVDGALAGRKGQRRAEMSPDPIRPTRQSGTATATKAASQGLRSRQAAAVSVGKLHSPPRSCGTATTATHTRALDRRRWTSSASSVRQSPQYTAEYLIAVNEAAKYRWSMREVLSFRAGAATDEEEDDEEWLDTEDAEDC